MLPPRGSEGPERTTHRPHRGVGKELASPLLTEGGISLLGLELRPQVGCGDRVLREAWVCLLELDVYRTLVETPGNGRRGTVDVVKPE